MQARWDRHVREWRGWAWIGKAAQAARGLAWIGKARRGGAGKAGLGQDWPG